MVCPIWTETKTLCLQPSTGTKTRSETNSYYCAFDPATPLRVRAILLAALAYFIMPIDVIPDLILGLGFTDDLTVLATAYALIHSHMRDEHWDKARETLERMRSGEAPET